MTRPARIDAIGNQIAIAWQDGTESFLAMEKLRACSPSAENVGEQDLLGRTYGGTAQREFPGVTVTAWRMVGGYAVQFDFSDGHCTGIFPFDLLQRLGE
ncbi:MAG: gamma-butyrobetaine hydroxylase-like domain-containing protein [Roseimicrobium sp.]